MRVFLTCVVLFGLSACSSAFFQNTLSEAENLDLLAETRRTYAESYLDLPFEDGIVHVVAEEHGDLHTYSLTPCGVNRVCGPDGRSGTVQKQDDHFVVTGAYSGRTFYLSPGGDGFLNWRGVNRDLAWN